MREIEFLNIIHNTLHNTQYLGDDTAYLKDLDIYVTHDTMVEDVHFSMETTKPFDLGYKSVAINLSDLAASGSRPLYVTISLSLPANTSKSFVKDFYKGVDKICEKYNVAVIGGDLTRSDKVVVSICAIGKKVSKYDVSRSYAKPGDVIIVTGTHGDSSAALKMFPKITEFSRKHIKPEPAIEQGLIIARTVTSNFAMMDTSDGLGDALYKIAKLSGVKMVIDFNKIPFNLNLKKKFPNEYKNMILWGGEDFELVASISKDAFDKLDKTRFYQVGFVDEEVKNGYVEITNGDNKIQINEDVFNLKSYKHFEDF